jgi:hypothetical protein
MDDSTLIVGNRCIFPIFFAAYHYAPQKIKKLPSISHSSRNEPHNLLDSQTPLAYGLPLSILEAHSCAPRNRE